MSKKAVLICISAIVVLLAVVAAAVSVLYSGVETGRDSGLNDPRYSLFHAVPSDAVAVLRFSDVEKMTAMLADTASAASYLVPSSETSFSRFLTRLSALSSGRSLPLASSAAVLSLHYNGSLIPLVIADAGRAGQGISEEAAALAAEADSAGLYSSYTDCGEFEDVDSRLARKSILLISPSDALVKSAQRHLSRNISVIDSDGFSLSASDAAGEDLLFISGRNMKKLFDGMFTGKYRRHADFFSRMSEWNAFSVTFSGSSHVGLAGNASFSEDAADFMKIFSSVQPGTSSVSSMLPSYAFFAASLPFGDVSAYIDAYQQFADTGNGAVKLLSARKELARRSGVSPVEWASALSIQESGVVAFYAGKNLEQVVLLKVGKEDVPLIFKGTDVTGLKGYEPKVHSYAYAGFAASLFGPMFNVGDESCFTYMDGWIISGSAVGVGEYVSGRALENTLKGYMADAGLEDRLSAANRCFVSYFSLSENPEALGGIFSKRYAESMARSLEGITYEPVTMSVGKEKSSLEICLDLDRVTVRKSKPPVFERDTVIVVSRGPFRVKNSGTGRMNLFYQQDNMYLCLQEENGKGIWAAPFSSPIAGRAGTIDYFANGKLQILFASGSKLHLIDRLGRFVSPFPIDLGKNILLGPDIYDFNGSRRYNVMVLHDDNTIDMYNLQGRKPLQWKGITAQETIKGLPEALKAGGRTYWVVRTSMQTLIYPFYGGEPLTKGTGDRMIRPDSKVVPVSGNTVKAVCYDGKEHDFRL